MSKKKFRTDYLFPSTGFFRGIGSVMNIAGSYYNFNYSESEEVADWKAILNDWGVIGQDIENAVSKVTKESSKDTCSLLSQE